MASDDTRNFDSVTQGQDLFTAEVQYDKIGGGTSKATKIVIAGVLGLAAVGLALLGAGLATRRGSGAPAKPAPAKTPAKA